MIVFEDCRRKEKLENVKMLSTLDLQKKYLTVVLGAHELLKIVSVAVS